MEKFTNTMCALFAVHHRRWAKTRGMCLDARADFSGKKLVFSQTNSHLLSGRGEVGLGQKGGMSAIIAAPTFCLPAAAPKMLDTLLCKTNQKNAKRKQN